MSESIVTMFGCFALAFFGFMTFVVMRLCTMLWMAVEEAGRMMSAPQSAEHYIGAPLDLLCRFWQWPVALLAGVVVLYYLSLAREDIRRERLDSEQLRAMCVGDLPIRDSLSRWEPITPLVIEQQPARKALPERARGIFMGKPERRGLQVVFPNVVDMQTAQRGQAHAIRQQWRKAAENFFIVAGEAGSLSRSAMSRHVSQPTWNTTVSQLERLGVLVKQFPDRQNSGYTFPNNPATDKPYRVEELLNLDVWRTPFGFDAPPPPDLLWEYQNQ